MNINDPLYIASSDHPGMILTNTPFNGSNFHGWSRNIKMALGAKLKLGFIDGSCIKPASDHDDLQIWIRFMLVKLWKEIRIDMASIGPLLYQLERELSKISQVMERRKIFKGNRNEVKGETKNEISFKKICTNCGQEGHLFEQCFERLGYPNWYKGKKAKKNNRLAAHVNSGFDEHFSGETPFDMGYENEVGLGQNGHVDQKLVAAVCQEMMKMFRGRASSKEKRGASSSHAGILSCFTASFALFCHPDMDLLLDWISDSGASDHMSPHLNLFITTKHLKKPIIVHLPDGTSKTMTIVGQVQLTPSLILTDVFYVPDFQLNLLSVDKLIKTRQLAACFYPNDFVFRDLTTNQIVAVGKGYKNLYICKPTLDQATFDAQVSTFCKTYQNIIPVHCFNKNAFSNSVSKHSVDIKTFHERLAHTSTQVYDLLVSFLAYVTNHFKASVKIIRLDNGIEIVNAACNSLFMSKYILHKRFMAYTPQQNGVVERKHRHLLDTARAIRLHVKLPIKFWGDCVLAATYLINKMPMEILEWKSLYEKLFGQPPVYDYLRVIGCLCYAAVTIPQKDKFDNKGIKCVLLGYPMNQKGYRLYNLQTQEVFTSRDDVFKEDVFPFKDYKKPEGFLFVHDFPSFGDEFYPETTQTPLPLDPTIVIPNTPIPSEPDNENFGNENSDSSTNSILQNVNPLPPEPTRRSTRQSTRPAWLKDFVAPTGTKSSPHYPLFASTDFPEAMNKELEALKKNNTWTLTELPLRHKAITSKWVYKTKFKTTGIIERLKARLVVRDDVLITGNTPTEIDTLKKSLDDKFTIKDLGLAKYFLGIEICHTSTRLPDISYVVQHLSQFVSSPKDVHLQAAIHLLKYLKGTASKGFFYPIQPHLQVTGFADADWASCLMTRKSLTEYRSMATTTCELLWLSFLLKDLHIPVKLPITLFCDNKSAQQIAANPCFHERTKHMDIDTHFTREKVQDGFLQTAFIPSHLQFADIMTKALNSVQHSFLAAKLGVTTGSN
ncbi:copia protein [Tanacetum coccineum]